MCIHYTRNIKVKCDECDLFYDCHKCHDADLFGGDQKGAEGVSLGSAEGDILIHEFTRENLKTIKCNSCNAEQTPSEDNKCEKCNDVYSMYSCIKCSYFGLEETVHCDVCRICYKKNITHTCFENLISEKCSICLSNLISKNTVIITCHHVFHSDCLYDYVKSTSSPTCPLCRQSFGDSTVFCNYCKKTFYGSPRGTRLDCGHYYHMECLPHLSSDYRNNTLNWVQCHTKDCRRIHYIKNK
jgi:hypothetical protein